MTSRYKYLFILYLALTAACFPKDKAVKLPSQSITDKYFSFYMGSNYERSCYFDLEGTDTLASYNNNQWDLAFQCAQDSFHIFINGENQALVGHLGNIPYYAQVNPMDTTTNSPLWNKAPTWPHDGTIYDASSWRSDSTAFGNWYFLSNTHNGGCESKQEVYLLDRGALRASGVRFRILSFQIDHDMNGNQEYEIFYSNIDGSDFHKLEVPKNAAKNFIYASLADSGHIIDFGAPKNGFDLEFTRYRYVYYHNANPPFLLYPLTGAMINTFNTRVATDSVESYTSITPANFNPNKYTYSTSRDVIGGFNWKSYSISAGRYTIHSNIVYIIQNRDGYYYKLHFIGYYNNQGNEGAPQFEFQRLQ